MPLTFLTEKLNKQKCVVMFAKSSTTTLSRCLTSVGGVLLAVVKPICSTIRCKGGCLDRDV
eukprot:2187792-Amphidinium_carterae.1